MARGRAGLAELRGSRLLSKTADLRERLALEARALGFDAFGIVAPDAIPNALPRLKEFLADGGHGEMAWLATNPERRADPRTLWSDVRSIVMLGVNYGPDEDPLQILTHRDRGAISTYARGDDYHELIKSRLKALARWMVAHAGGDVKVFVDTAAVMEKPLSEAAGLGWQGKHTNLVSREFGSWLFLARSSPRWICQETRATRTVAARAARASMRARPTHFLRLIGWMRGAAFRT